MGMSRMNMSDTAKGDDYRAAGNVVHKGKEHGQVVLVHDVQGQQDEGLEEEWYVEEPGEIGRRCGGAWGGRRRCGGATVEAEVGEGGQAVEEEGWQVGQAVPCRWSGETTSPLTLQEEAVEVGEAGEEGGGELRQHVRGEIHHLLHHLRACTCSPSP